MKQYFSLLLLACFAVGLGSCEKDKADMPAEVEGLTAYPGRNRAEVEFEVPAIAVKGKVFYGNGNFKEFTITDPSVLQKVIVDSLNEEEQKLRVVTISGDGTVSNPRAITVNVYGQAYESSLKPRKWADQITHSANSLEFHFEDAVEGETGVNIIYTNTGGSPDSVTMNRSSNVITIDNIDTTQPYYYYSVHKPEPGTIDNFFSSTVDLKTALMLNFKKSNWSITSSSGEDSGFPASNVIDNDQASSWHSMAGVAFPHWIIIDMESPKFIDGFNYINFPGQGSDAKNLKFEISLDNVNWTNVLQTEVSESYLKQQLPLSKTVVGRYIKVTVMGTVDPAATYAEMGEIDAYNLQNVSADNGYKLGSPLALQNANPQFVGDGSNPFPALGEYRMQKIKDWTHSPNATVTYDDLGKTFSLFVAPVWGLSEVHNGKVFQSVQLEPGNYLLKISAGGGTGPAEVYGVVSTGNDLPDFAVIPASSATLDYSTLERNKNYELLISITEPTTVNIGLVYNLKSQYSSTGIPWSSFDINGFTLSSLE